MRVHFTKFGASNGQTNLDEQIAMRLEIALSCIHQGRSLSWAPLRRSSSLTQVSLEFGSLSKELVSL
ncbi:hypothetical protein GOP47_0009671 [Adiantum capillus-veneris]|uniref:Uncharacterized protein n=1 Tax=Adiantum capillus-veneris TaxID=13818 RepID=A0A9D4ZJW2_ADICA|nr:hypothetical protein GOP47_0009671 [Adiantum capillus-veneris]